MHINIQSLFMNSAQTYSIDGNSDLFVCFDNSLFYFPLTTASLLCFSTLESDNKTKTKKH